MQGDATSGRTGRRARSCGMKLAEFETRIDASSTPSDYWQQVWRYRELVFFLVWRDLLVRYKQTAMGIAWVVIRPAVSALIFTVVFGRLAKLPSDGLPYPVMVLAGLIAWQFFATAVTEVGGSLMGSANILSKVYFPRLVVPMSSLGVCFVELLFSLLLLVGLALWYGIVPDWRILFAPLFVLIMLAAGFGCGLWIAVLSLEYRDFRYVVPFMVQVGLYVSPVAFASSLVPPQWQLLYAVNPMVGVIDGFRWAISAGATSLQWLPLLVSALVAVVLLLSGFRLFRRTEKTFADRI